MSKIIKITAFFMFFVMCFCVKNISAQDLVGTCPYTHKWCCWNGKMTCVEKSSSAADYCTASCATLVDPGIGLDKPILPGKSCGTAGTKQYKYTASGCTNTISTRECCSSGSWSSWGGSCSISPVSSTVLKTLECTGTSDYYESFGNGSNQYTEDPTFVFPYPKCPSSNICSGKSSGWICYQSYTDVGNSCTSGCDCHYWTESGTTDQSQECYWCGSSRVNLSIITCQ